MPRKNPHAVALGRRSTPAKRRAARANGRLGGRRRKFDVGDRVRANDRAPSDYRDRVGFITEVGPGRSEYRVELDDGVRPTTGYLMSWSLDREK